MTWTVDSVTQLSTGYWKSAALVAAVELGIFEAMEAGGTGASIAAAVRGSPRHVEELLNALVAMGLLVRDGDAYLLASDAVPFLSRTSPTCLLDALRFNGDLYQLWGRLGACVREGKPALPPTAHLGADPERTRRFALGMHSRALAMAPLLVPAIDLKGRERLLDVGAGPGTFSRALAEAYAGLRVTLFDLAPILGIARELSDGSSVASRLDFHPGDYRRDVIPAGFDAILYCGALHQEEPEGAGMLFRKLWQSLRPGGVIHVVDMMVTADRSGPAFSVLFSLNMMLMSPIARVFSDADTLRLLSESGFERAVCVKPEGCPYWVVKAIKPLRG